MDLVSYHASFLLVLKFEKINLKFFFLFNILKQYKNDGFSSLNFKFKFKNYQIAPINKSVESYFCSLQVLIDSMKHQMIEYIDSCEFLVSHSNLCRNIVLMFKMYKTLKRIPATMNDMIT